MRPNCSRNVSAVSGRFSAKFVAANDGQRFSSGAVDFKIDWAAKLRRLAGIDLTQFAV
jgi:hypothetical protein